MGTLQQFFFFTFAFSSEINIILREPYSRNQWPNGAVERLLSLSPPPPLHPQRPLMRKGDGTPP